MGRVAGRILNLTVVLVVAVFALGDGASATVAVDRDQVEAIDRDGRYLEPSDSSVGPSIDAANRNGIAFVWLEGAGQDAEGLADTFVAELEAIGSDYHTVLVLTPDAFAAFSTVYSDREMDAALDDSFGSFSAGLTGRGIDVFTAIVTGTPLGGTGDQADSTTATTVPAGSAGSSDDGGPGFGTFLLGLAAVGGGFLIFRSWRGRRKAKAQEAIDLEEDRMEIEEQLKNNADRVILLGDRVIASDNRELISLYEEASQTYQDVSQSVADADTALEIDALDDRIDQAEWQFEVIEARLDGRPTPPPPAPDQDDAIDPGVGDRGVGDRAGHAPPPPPSVDPRSGGTVTSPTTGRSYPRPDSSGRTLDRPAPRNQPRSQPGRRGGLGGGGLGGILGGVIGNIILGGGLGGSSRRTQRRTGGFGAGFGSPRPQQRSGGIGAGGLGGGVLRRGGSTSRRSGSNTRSRTRSTRRGGSRSLGRRRGGSRKL